MHPVRFSAFLLTGIILALGCSDSGSGTSPGAAGANSAAGASGSAGGNAAGATGAGAPSTAGASGGGAAGVGMTGAAGAAAGSSSGGAGSHAFGNSTGCNKDVLELPTVWNSHSINVTVAAAYSAAFSTRTYFTRPPKDYDPSKSYPLVVWGQGCGQDKSEDTQFSGGPDAGKVIQVELLANPKNHNCYSAGPDGDHADTPELPYFDAVLAEVESKFCVDRSKVYMAGWSSGGWLTALLACTRTSVLKGVGWASAGLQLNHPECVGPMPAILERGVNDTGTSLPQAEQARDNLRMRNGCSTETEPWVLGEPGFDECVSYKGCTPGYPVVWCPIQAGHNNGGKLASVGYWKFWAGLP